MIPSTVLIKVSMLAKETGSVVDERGLVAIKKNKKAQAFFFTFLGFENE